MPNYLQAMAGRLGRGMGIDPRRRIAQQLMAQGMDTSPAHLGTGIGRLGKALAAAYMMRQSQDQEAAAMEWLTAKDPGRTPRQPTREEALATSQPLRELEIASDVGQPGGLVERLKALSNPDGLIVGEQQEPLGLDPLYSPQADQGTTEQGIPTAEELIGGLNEIQQMGPPVPKSFKGLDHYRRLAEQDFGVSPREEIDETVSEQFAPSGLPSGVATIGDDQIQEETFTKEPPRDYAQELKRGMTAYQSDPANQISDPRTRMEWLRESYRNNPELKNNWFANRLIQNLMFNEMQRGQEESVYQRRLKEKRADTKTASDIQESQFERKSSIQEKRLKQAGWKDSTRPAGGGLTQRILINPSTGEEKTIGEPYDAKLMSQAAVDQQTQIYAGKKAAMSPLQEKQVEKIDREKKKDVQEIKTIKLKDRSALQDFKRKTDTLTQTIADAESMINTYSTGFKGGVAQYLPWSTDRSRLDDYLTTLKANLGFDSLQKMRDNSKTGGALGQVSEMENKLLQAINGALNPKNPGVMQANLDRIKELYPQVLIEKMQVYQDTYGEAYNKPSGDRRGRSGSGRVAPGWDPEDWKFLTDAEKKEAWGER